MNTATVVQNLPTARIVAGNNDRKRFAEEELRLLADSLAQEGLISAITVRPLADGERFELIAGERRFRASQLLHWEAIPAIVLDVDDRRAARLMLIENTVRVDLDPIEEAGAYRKNITEFGITLEELARDAHITVKRIKDRLALLRLNGDIQTLIKHGHMGLGYAMSMVDLDSNFQAQAMRYFQQNKPTLSGFRALCGQLLEHQAQGSMFDMDAFMVELVQVATSQGSVPQKPVHVDVQAMARKLPVLKKGANLQTSLEAYKRELAASADPDLQAASVVVDMLFQGLQRTGLMRQHAELAQLFSPVGNSGRMTIVRTD